MSDIGDVLTQTLRSAPELASSPGLALGAASSGTDPTVAGQAMAQTANYYAQQQAVDNTSKVMGHPDLFHQALGWLGGAAHAVNQATGGYAGKALNLVGAPLREVQTQYRYLHDVEARHGPLAALLEGVGIAAGAGLGAWAGGPQGVVLGGELASEVESHLFYKDSLKRVQNGAGYQGTYNRQTGQYSGDPGKVSIGRDVASAIGLKPGSKPYTYVSGAGDALTDLSLDPLVQVGSLGAAARGEEGLASHIPALADRFPGTRFVTPDDVDNAVQRYGSVRRGMQQLADATTEQLTSSKKWAPLAAQLGPANTVDEVAQVFKDQIDVARTVSSTLPTSTIVGGLAKKAARAVTEYEGPGSSAIRSATEFTASAFDPATLSLSGREFDPASDQSIHGVYQVARYSMTKRASEMLAGAYANAIPGERIGIYENVVTRMLAARGLEEDSPFVKHELDQLLGGSAPGHDAHYATGALGRDISKLPAADDLPEQAAAVLQNQTGKLAYPNFNVITRETRRLSNFKNLYGAADDFIYKDFTQNIFKRLALLSGGFAQRIAMAEAIPAIAREGFTNLVKHQLATTAAKLGYEATTDPEEMGRIAGLVWHLGRGADRVAGGAGQLLNKPETVEDLTDMVSSLNGQRLPAAVDTTTHYSGEVGGADVKAERQVKSAMSQIPPGKMTGDKFMLFGSNDLHFDQAWAQKLSTLSRDEASQAAAREYAQALDAGAPAEEASQKGAEAATNWWKTQDPRVLSLYQRSIRSSTPGVDPMEDWGRVIMENVRGASHSPDVADEAGQIISRGTPDRTILRNIADGTQTDMGYLSSVAPELKPAMVEGRALIDIPHQNVLARISNFGFSRVLDPIINKLSREPIYANEWLKQYQPFKPLIESGALDKGDAIQIAHQRAVQNMVPFIHNVLERSQFSELAHNYMPFFFAQQQAFARYGRFLADDPGAFRQLQLMTTGLHNTAAQTKDANGQSWMVYPGLGFMTNATVGTLGSMGIPVAGSVPVSYSGRVASLSSVFPLSDVAPKFGPVVAIAGHVLENWFPEMRPAVTKVIGEAGNSGSVWSQLIPNTTIKGLITAFGNEHSRTFASAAMSQIQSLSYQQNVAMDAWVKAGHSPDDPGAPHIVPSANAGPQAMQEFADRVKNQTRILFATKAIIGAVTPTAVTPNLGDMGLKQEFADAVAKDGFSKGVAAFLKANPDATPYTVFQSDAPLGSGAVLNSTEAENFYNAHDSFLKQFPYAGVWLLPQMTDPKFDQSIYNEQLAQGLRVKRTPQQFSDQLYIAAGDHQFFDVDQPAYAKAKAALEAQGADTSDLSHRWSDYLTTMSKANPIWWNDFQSGTRQNERDLAASQMVEMFKHPNVPTGPQTADLAGLVEDYQKYTGAIAAGRQDSYADASRTELKQRWQAYVLQLAQEKPNLAPVINTVFKGL